MYFLPPFFHPSSTLLPPLVHPSFTPRSLSLSVEKMVALESKATQLAQAKSQVAKHKGVVVELNAKLTGLKLQLQESQNEVCVCVRVFLVCVSVFFSLVFCPFF